VRVALLLTTTLPVKEMGLSALAQIVSEVIKVAKPAFANRGALAKTIVDKSMVNVIIVESGFWTI
jgi:stage III sporulation protein SpoIIIAA